MAGLMLGAAVASDVLVVLLFLAAPNTMRPMYSSPPSSLVWLLPAIGLIMNLVGLGSMIRIYPADPEGHRSWWRFQGR
jgi:hypothetical protein